MELPWNICPYCGTTAPGMRREHLTLDEALRPLPEEPVVLEEAEFPLPAAAQEEAYFPDPEEELEEFEEVPVSLERATQTLSNSVSAFLGRLDEGLGLTRAMAGYVLEKAGHEVCCFTKSCNAYNIFCSSTQAEFMPAAADEGFRLHVFTDI